MDAHLNNDSKDGKETNPAISEILRNIWCREKVLGGLMYGS